MGTHRTYTKNKTQPIQGRYGLRSGKPRKFVCPGTFSLFNKKKQPEQKEIGGNRKKRRQTSDDTQESVALSADTDLAISPTLIVSPTIIGEATAARVAVVPPKK